jgi:hypothetical protein
LLARLKFGLLQLLVLLVLLVLLALFVLLVLLVLLVSPTQLPFLSAAPLPCLPLFVRQLSSSSQLDPEQTGVVGVLIPTKPLRLGL